MIRQFLYNGVSWKKGIGVTFDFLHRDDWITAMKNAVIQLSNASSGATGKLV